MFAIMPFIYGSPAIRFHMPQQVPGGDLLQMLVKGGFVLFAIIAVIVLSYKANDGRASIRRNKAKNSRPRRSGNNELGSGDLATKAQIQRWLSRNDKYDTVLPVKLVKGSDGIACKQGTLVIPAEERNRHILVIAKTGSGKTTRAILPVLFNDCLCPERSTIVLDSKPEMWDKLVGLTRKYNPEKRILLFNPLDTVRGLSWNILSKIQTDTDAKLIANTIISATDNPTAKSDSPFFRNNALSLLNSIMVGLLSDPKEKLSMPRVHQLVNGGMEPLCRWLESHPQAIRNSKTFVDLARSGSQNADTIMSELGMRLAAWDLSSIRATTALDELDLELLITHPTLLIIELRESELEMLRPMANVIVVELLRYLTKRAESYPGGKLPRPIGLVIDEFASALGRLPDIHVKLNTLRSRNVSIVAAIQSIAQIKANYDRDADSVIAGFSTKIIMPTLDFQDAEWASKETGTMTVRFNLASIGKNKRMIDYFATKNDNTQEQVQQRPVLTPDEIGRPVDNANTFFMPNTPVFQGHLVPYFEVPELMVKFDAGKKVDFRLREAPIEFEDAPPEIPTEPVAPAGQSPEEIQAALQEVRNKLSFDACDTASRDWWISLEKLNENSPVAVINLAEQLLRRNLTIAEFYQIYVASGVDNIEDLLKKIDETLLARLRTSLGWETSNQNAKDWWISFEQANQASALVVVELAHELLRKGVSIEDFFSAYVHSDCNSVPEVLQVIDQLIEEKRKAAEQGLSSGDGTPHRALREEVSVEHVAASQSPFEEAPMAQVSTAVAQERPDENTPGTTKVRVVSTAADKQRKQKAALSVHVNSYMEMGQELLSQGKLDDFQKLMQLASEDTRFPAEYIQHLEQMRTQYSKL